MPYTKPLALAGAVTAVLLSLAGVAHADAPKFHAVDSGVTNTGTLVVSWDERGLGDADVTYTLTADATAAYACINGGGNHPQAANKETVAAQVSAGGSFEPKNGRVLADLTTGPLSPGDFACPSGQNLVLVGVSYTHGVLTDTTNGVTAGVPDTSEVFVSL